MNRCLMAAVMGLIVVGCAAGVEDPQPAPGPDPVQKEAPAQTFSAEVEQISENLPGWALETRCPRYRRSRRRCRRCPAGEPADLKAPHQRATRDDA